MLPHAMNLTGRRVLVTGASSGIGRATAVLLSQLGAKLVLVARNEEQLQQTASLLNGGEHLIKPYDLAKSGGIPEWMKELSGDIGALNGLVHSAGIQLMRPIRFQSQEEVEETFRINVTAGVQLIKGFRQKGVCSRPSSIVLLSSVMGLVGQSGLSTYAASKAAVLSLARSLAVELASEGIRVNAVAPGQVRTEMAKKIQQTLSAEQFAKIEAMHPLGLGEPEDVANAVAFLLADTARWITGSTLVVDGGYTAQ